MFGTFFWLSSLGEKYWQCFFGGTEYSDIKPKEKMGPGSGVASVGGMFMAPQSQLSSRCGSTLPIHLPPEQTAIGHVVANMPGLACHRDCESFCTPREFTLMA